MPECLLVSTKNVLLFGKIAEEAAIWGAAIDEVRLRGDSCGGEVTCVIRSCPKGLGSPVFDKLEAELCKALMSLPASKVRCMPLSTSMHWCTSCASVMAAA